jgi:hypothetical protein
MSPQSPLKSELGRNDTVKSSRETGPSTSADTTKSPAREKSTLPQSEINKAFEKELKRVYYEIDKFSDLLWAAKNTTELYSRRKGSTRPDLRNDLTQQEKDQNREWERETKATFGYGEITRVSKMS